MKSGFAIFVVSILLLSSCCTKVECSLNENKSFHFSGFDSSDLSEILVVRNSKEYGGFKDSIWTSAALVDGKMMLQNPYSIEKYYAYLIVIKKQNLTYNIDDYNYIKEQISCNKCFKKEYTDKLIAYRVNGVVKNYDAANGFEIAK